MGSSEPSSPRLSFANASFGRSTSPTISTAPKRSSFQSRPTPDQLVALARPVHTGHAPPGHQLATFTPLPANILLPFLDRPKEVAELIASSPTSKLINLLSKTLPSSCSTPDDPATWSITDLTHYLCAHDRDTDPDDVWVSRIRSAIYPHSELIWERFKAALGVPAELEPGFEVTPAQPRVQIDQHHYNDDYSSDVFMDSPVIEPQRPHSRTSSIGSFRHEPEFMLVPPTPQHEVDLTISPMLHAVVSPVASPMCDAAGHLLQNISEEAENEEDAPEVDLDMYSPNQIQGLKIASKSTSSLALPLTPPPAKTIGSPLLHPKSPSHPGSRLIPGRRSSSFGYEKRSASLSRLSGEGIRGSSSTSRLAEPHRPLFPSNFARLSPDASKFFLDS